MGEVGREEREKWSRTERMSPLLNEEQELKKRKRKIKRKRKRKRRMTRGDGRRES